jgi:hypothetical protein
MPSPVRNREARGSASVVTGAVVVKEVATVVGVDVGATVVELRATARVEGGADSSPRSAKIIETTTARPAITASTSPRRGLGC